MSNLNLPLLLLEIFYLQRTANVFFSKMSNRDLGNSKHSARVWLTNYYAHVCRRIQKTKYVQAVI